MKIHIKIVFVILTLSFFVSGCIDRKWVPFSRERTIYLEKNATAEAEEKIRNSPELQKVDNVCRQIQLPESFNFVSKQVIGSNKKFITYNYRSDEGYHEVHAFYLEYFKKDGWELTADKIGMIYQEIKFKKEEYEVSLYYNGKADRVQYSLMSIETEQIVICDTQ
jgi:hypothetical protein